MDSHDSHSSVKPTDGDISNSLAISKSSSFVRNSSQANSTLPIQDNDPRIEITVNDSHNKLKWSGVGTVFSELSNDSYQVKSRRFSSCIAALNVESKGPNNTKLLMSSNVEVYKTKQQELHIDNQVTPPQAILKSGKLSRKPNNSTGFDRTTSQCKIVSRYSLPNTRLGKLNSECTVRQSLGKQHRQSLPCERSKVQGKHDSDIKESTTNRMPDGICFEAKDGKKVWHEQGLYCGQERLFAPCFDTVTNPKAKYSEILANKDTIERRYLPLPMFLGELIIFVGRNYQLPFNIMNLLPHDVKPKDGLNAPDRFPKSRFIGDAGKDRYKVTLGRSCCNCSEDQGCGERCLNVCMKIECDSTNCNIVSRNCGNRKFSKFVTNKRVKLFDIGLELMETENRGYGIRAVRRFEPDALILEYTGDVITMDEAKRRQCDDYTSIKNFYMLALGNGLVIDATRHSSLARYVNHSCAPNCKMEGRVVKGVERIVLIAGDRGVDVGEEITYDYDFMLFDGAGDSQECLCGALNCRGYMGKKRSNKQVSQINQRTKVKHEKLKGRTPTKPLPTTKSAAVTKERDQGGNAIDNEHVTTSTNCMEKKKGSNKRKIYSLKDSLQGEKATKGEGEIKPPVRSRRARIR